MKLNVKALALTSGILWGLGVFITTWWMIIWSGSSGDPTWLGMIYRGYNISALGSIIGLVWAFVDGLVCGAIFAWLYNKLCGGKAPAAAE